MKTSKTILVGILSVGSVGLAATTALACHGGRSYSGYSTHYSPRYVEHAYITEVAPPVVAPAFAPAHSIIAVMPGDSWPSICQREYGNPGVWSKIAEFNGIPQNMQLNPGMQLRLPVVNPNGSFSISSAPAAIAMPPQGFAGGMPQGQPQGMPQGFAGGMQQGQPGFPQGFAGQMPQGQPQGFAGGNPQGQPQGMPQGFAGGMPQGQSQGFAGSMPQAQPQGMPQGMPEGFAGSMPQGAPQDAPSAQAGGMPQAMPFAGEMPQGTPQANLTAPQGGLQQGMPQGFAGGAPQGMQQGAPQGNFAGPQGGTPQTNGPVQQIQAMPPQQPQMGLQQGPQSGQPMQQMPPQGPLASQGPEDGPKDAGSIAQRIADQVTGLSDLLSSRPATPNAGPTDRLLPSIVIGSLMTINGQQLGDNRGTVRLMVNGSPVPLEIVEWSAASAKVRIPGDLPPGIQAQIEIMRADGSVVAKDAVQLAADQKVAAAN
jgi:hypothetical protein